VDGDARSAVRTFGKIDTIEVGTAPTPASTRRLRLRRQAGGARVKAEAKALNLDIHVAQGRRFDALAWESELLAGMRLVHRHASGLVRRRCRRHGRRGAIAAEAGPTRRPDPPLVAATPNT
jgi:hypothetical protein